jgi:hypothetical protein
MNASIYSRLAELAAAGQPVAVCTVTKLQECVEVFGA